MKTLRQAALDAVLWFREYPERHIMGLYALSADGQIARPTEASAHCFCYLGRVMCNMGENYAGSAYDPLRDTLCKVVANTGTIIQINDDPALSLSDKLDIFSLAASLLPEEG